MANIGEDLGRIAREESQDELGKLIFPINVQESMQASGGMRKGEKVGLLIAFWLFICGVAGWFLAGWLRTVVPQYYVLIVVLIEVVLQLTVGVYILRFALDERSVFAEMNDSDKSFANYFKIYREIKAADGSKYPFDVIEFDDGSIGVFLECRLGFNTQNRSENTYFANKAVTDLLNKANLPRKTFYHNESFKTSQAAQDLRDVLKGIEDPNMFAFYRDIVQNYLRIAEEESNVICVTRLIYAPTRLAKDELLSTMGQIFAALEKDETVYRQISALKYEEIVEFLRHYYKLEVLDMGLIRAHIAAKKNSYSCPVKVLKIYGRSGRIYANDEFKKLSSEIRSTGGLSSMN